MIQELSYLDGFVCHLLNKVLDINSQAGRKSYHSINKILIVDAHYALHSLVIEMVVPVIIFVFENL